MAAEPSDWADPTTDGDGSSDYIAPSAASLDPGDDDLDRSATTDGFRDGWARGMAAGVEVGRAVGQESRLREVARAKAAGAAEAKQDAEGDRWLLLLIVYFLLGVIIGASWVRDRKETP